MSKYQPLERYLSRQSDRTITLTFNRIEEIIGDALPDSASSIGHGGRITVSDMFTRQLGWMRAGRWNLSILIGAS